MMKSDAQLQQDVLAELKWEASVNAADIGVEVKEGVVTLAGHVSNYAEKWGAEKPGKSLGLQSEPVFTEDRREMCMRPVKPEVVISVMLAGHGR
jgi:hypothetical protein